METLMGSLASPGNLPLAEQIVASVLFIVDVGCLVFLRLLGRREPAIDAEENEYDEAA